MRKETFRTQPFNEIHENSVTGFSLLSWNLRLQPSGTFSGSLTKNGTQGWKLHLKLFMHILFGQLCQWQELEWFLVWVAFLFGFWKHLFSIRCPWIDSHTLAAVSYYYPHCKNQVLGGKECGTELMVILVFKMTMCRHCAIPVGRS